jgi:hypothetical protein
MVNLETKARQCLKEFDLRALFIEEMGWDHHISSLEVLVDGLAYPLKAVAQKRGMVVFVCPPVGDGVIPDYPTRRKIEKQVAKSVHEHLIIYPSKDNKFQIWQWVKREPGKPTQCREHRYYCNQPGDSLLQKLNAIAFSLDEEEGLTIVDVASRVRAGFDIDRVTKKFYDRFKSEHDTFLKFLKGIPDEEMQRWYASVMLNRLMFIYFIQKKRFLDNNTDYLRDKLNDSKQRGKDRFYKDFLCPLFFEGFAKKENERTPTINKLLGEVPFLNGGIFQPHQLEELYSKSIQIGDAAFEKLFNFFDQYQWHLDERPLRADNEINPDVLGYIFEKYINQKQMGAYYTKEDITDYISKNTIIPYLFDEAKKKCKIAFEGEQSIWRLLQTDPDRYIYDAVKKGIVRAIHESPLPLPPEIAVGLSDVSKRTEWNKPASEEYALPTEIWREVVARRNRYEELRAKLANGEIQDINDLVTYNLSIRQFAQDVIENCEGPELLRAFWHAIEQVSILDPACGSGAFLFAALNILEPLYEACLERMEVFLDELERSGEKHRPEKFGDFRKVLGRIEKHPNRRYFIFKSIIVNNLYGVDIMEEAIEICKLRLFLKLVAQIERDEDIEPLPDIDFNICPGNTLVGYITYDEVKKAVLGDTQGKFDLGKDMQRIEEKAQDVDRLFELFRQQQTEIGGEVTPADKQELRKLLRALEDELNRYLAGEYKIDLNKKEVYEKWLTSHKPFHWFIEFYGVIKKGGFDVIISNPPYVEYVKVKSDYSLVSNVFATERCGNLYAFICERCLKLLTPKGRVGVIILLSGFGTKRMLPLQTLYREQSSLLVASHYEATSHPSVIFVGVEAQLSIILACKRLSNAQVSARTYTSNYIRTYSVERDFLFDRVGLLLLPSTLWESRMPRLSHPLEISILAKLLRKPGMSSVSPQEEVLMFRSMGNFFWKLAFTKEPTFQINGVQQRSSTLGVIRVPKPREVIQAVIFSTLFYWHWSVYSDVYHLTKSDILSFPFSLSNLSSGNLKRLVTLACDVEENLFSTARFGDYERKNGRYYFHRFFPHSSKLIIDEIDQVLARHYGFTEEELDFIINYDIKYRMGRDTGEEAEEE